MADEIPLIDSSLLEGLFVKSLKVDPQLKAKLAAVGYDLDRPLAKYTNRVFVDCIDVAARHLFPGQPAATGKRELGRRLVDGFAHTVLGSVLLAIVPRVPPSIVLDRFPRWVSATAGGQRPRVETVSSHERRLVMPTELGTDSLPDLMCGIFERLVRGWTVVEVVSVAPTEVIYRIAWT